MKSYCSGSSRGARLHVRIKSIVGVLPVMTNKMQVRGRRCKKSLVGVAVVELLVLPQEAVLYPQQLLLGGLGGLDLTAGPRPPPRRCCRLEGSFAL